jgi:hypothetical protein
LLAYLDMLCAALLARESWEIRRLLKHPLARVLPRRVREEAYAIARLGVNTKRAPIHTLNFYHQTVQLLGSHAEPVPADTAAPAEAQRPAEDQGPDQLELPLLPRTQPERRAG